MYFKIDYVCKIPPGGNKRVSSQETILNTLLRPNVTYITLIWLDVHFNIQNHIKNDEWHKHFTI